MPPRAFRSSTIVCQTSAWSPHPLGEKPLSTSHWKSMVVAAMWIESAVTPRQVAVNGTMSSPTWFPPAGEYS